MQTATLSNKMEKTKVQEQLSSVYDYIIIGAGTSGCVVANRLTEDPSKTVLVIEAGGDDREYPDISVPGNAGRMQKTAYDWCYKTVPQQHAFKGYENQVYNMPRGKVLGGSGCLNYMIYMRGTPHDFDIWENMGCTGWSYKDVLPYFLKSESCLVSKLVESGYHGTSGPMMVSEAKFSALPDVFVEAGKELGYRETDCNGRDPLGFMVIQSFIGDGIRQSAAEVFLRPASHRKNLHIATHCHVTKILIDNQVARAVQFLRGGRSESIRARREIILSAGTIGSPQTLMLSGIGPKYHLQSLKIPLVADLPVGDNLQDHPASFGIEFLIDEPWSASPDVMKSEETRQRYDVMRSGPLATNVTQATALIRSRFQDAGNPNPDIQIITLDSLIGADKESNFQSNTTMTDRMWDSMFSADAGKHGVTFCLSLTHARNRGSIRLKTTDPFDHPLVDPQTLSHPDDTKVLVEAVKIVQRLEQTKAYMSVGAKMKLRVLPGYNGTPFTDEYWEEVFRTLTYNTYHPCGTCRMGPVSESTTVVDSQLRVKGVRNLRVVDASIMPEIISTNIYAPCVMIGEKAADMIKGERLLSNL